MVSNFQKSFMASFCRIHKDYFRFILVFVFGFLFYFGMNNSVFATPTFINKYSDSEYVKFYKDSSCRNLIPDRYEPSYDYYSSIFYSSSSYFTIYAKVDTSKAYIDGNNMKLSVNSTGCSFSVESSNIGNGVYKIEIARDSGYLRNCSHEVWITILNLKVNPKLSNFNSYNSNIQFYKEQSCENKISDSFEVSNGSVVYAKIDSAKSYVLGNDAKLNVALVYSESGYNFYTQSEHISNENSVYKITFKEKNNNFKTNGGNITIGSVNLAERTDYNINFNLPENINIYESDENANQGNQILLEMNSYTENILMPACKTRYFLIMPYEDKYIKHESLEFSYIAAGFEVSSEKISSQSGGKYLITITDNSDYCESDRQNNVNSIFIRASFLDRTSFYVIFPSVHGIEFVNSSNQLLSGKQKISNFMGDYEFYAKVNKNVYQGNDLEAIKNIEFSLDDDFYIQSEYDPSTNVFSFVILGYTGKNDESHILSLLVNSSGVKKTFVKLSVPTGNYTDSAKFYYLESNGILSANNYRIENEILVFPGINFNLYVRVDVDGEYDIDTLVLRTTNSTISVVSSKQEGIDAGKKYYYSKYAITQLFNDANVSVNLDLKKYKINLLKKVSGLDQVEYEVNYLNQSSSINHGSTSGRDYTSLCKGEKINFVFKFSEKGYNQLEMKDLKLRVYATKSDGTLDTEQLLTELNIGKREGTEINNEGIIDVSQNYYSEPYEIQGYPVGFGVEGIKKDKHTIEIITDDEFENNNYDITQLVNIVPNVARVTDKNESTEQNQRKKYVIDNQEYGSYLDFLIEFKNEEPGAGYNQSVPQVSGVITGSTDNLSISQKSDGYWRLKVTGDSTLTVNKITRNNYKITVPETGGITYKYKKVSEDYTGTESLEYYEDVPRNNQIPVKYEDYIAIVADFDYGVGLDMDKLEVNDDKITVRFEGETFKGFVIPKISGNSTLDVSAPLRTYNVSFNKVDGKTAKIYDNSGNVLNVSDAPAIKLVHGSDYKFKVDVDYKYSKSQQDMEVVLLNDVNDYKLKKDDEEIKTFMLEIRNDRITGKKSIDGNSDYMDYSLINSEGEIINVNDCNLKDKDGKNVVINDLEVKVKYGKVKEIKNTDGSLLANYTLTYHDKDKIVTPDDDGNYSLSSVSSADVVVRGLELNKYNLNFQNTNLITFTEFIENSGYKLVDENGSEIEKFNIEIKDGSVKAVKNSAGELLENYKLTNENGIEINSYKLVDEDGKDADTKSFSIVVDGGRVDAIKDLNENVLQNYIVVVEQNIGGAKDFEKKSVKKEVTIGDTIKFSYKLSEGYSLEGAEITSNGEALRKSDGMYVIYDISENMNIEANDLSKVKYRLTFSTESGVSFTDNYGESISSVMAEYSSNYSFRVLVDSKYSQSENSIEVYYLDSDDREVLLKKDVSGAYTIRNITGPVNVKVRGVEINRYKVSLPIDAEGIVFGINNTRSDDEDISEFESNMSINHGENFNFSVIALKGYDISDIAMSVVSANSTATVDVVNDGYMIQNVSENLELNISGVKRESHTVKLVGDNIIFKSDVSSSTEIKDGVIDYEVGQLNFMFLPAEGFEMVDDYESNWKNMIEVSPSGFYTPGDTNPSGTSPKPVLLNRNEGDNESYTVSEVTDDITITINGAVKKKSYKVVFPDVEGIKYLKFEDGSTVGENSGTDYELPLENTVNYDDTFRFEVKSEYGYDISNMQIRYGVNNYLSPVNGMYYINNIRSNVTLEVLYVNKNNYNVKLKGQNITFYDEDNKNPITDASIKYESGTFKFRLRPNIGYDLDLDNVVFDINGVEYDHKGNNSNSNSSIVVQGPDSSDVFTISNVNKSATLGVKGATKQKYQIHFPINTDGIRFAQDNVVKDASGNDKIETRYLNETEITEYLSEFKFYVIPRKGHNTDGLNVTVDPVNNADISYIDGGYTLSMIQGDFYVNVSNVGKNNYKVSFEGNGAEFFNSNNIKVNSTSVEYGSSYEFKLQSSEGYDVGSGYILHMYNPLNPNDRVTINNRYDVNSGSQENGGYLNDGEDDSRNPVIGTTLLESGRLTYRISNLQDNMVIQIEDVAKNKYNIFFPNVQGIKFISDSVQEIPHGGTFSFKIQELEGYTIKNIKVWANSNAVELVNGQYTLDNIINDMVISVEGVQSTKVDFKFDYVKGVIYKDTSNGVLSTLDTLKIDNGSNYSFKIDLSPDYSNSIDNMEVYVNREKKNVVDGEEITNVVKEKLEDVRGIYTVQNITENTTITVEKVEINSYNVKLTETTGIEYLDKYGDKKLSSEEKINYGESFSFMVNTVRGFVGSDIIVTAKGQNVDKVQLTAVDGVYTIDNVQSDYTIVVENVSKAIYKVEVRLLDGVNLLDNKGNKLSTSLTVSHGNDLSFRLSLDEAYSNSVPEVSVKGSNNKITPVNNVYTIKSIENDTIVEVTNVKKNTYEIKFKETEGVVYKNSKNKIFTGSLEVEYGGTLQFKVVLKDAYDSSYPVVLLNNKDAISQNGGTYELINVRDNGEISVDNVVKNSESSVIEMVEGIDEQIDSLNDTESVVEASKKYEELNDEEKDLLTNISKLKNAQEQVGKIHHESNGVMVSGIDWNIKVEAIALGYDKETLDRLSEKMERKSVVSLYEIKLVDTLTGEKYEIPYGSEVSVSIPAPNLEGYQNEVIVHENSVGSIEYLDVLISDGTANFTTKSFSIFGIAAKEIPNYSENSSDITISVDKLLKDSNVELEDLMYNGLESQLGDLTGGSSIVIGGSSKNGGSLGGSKGSSSGSGSSGNGGTGSGTDSSSGSNGLYPELNTGIAVVDNTYSWIMNNEFIIVVSLVGVIVVGVSVFLFKTRNKENS